MRTSNRGKELIKEFEQCRLKAYKPTPNDVWTIGWGATGLGITKGLEWSQKGADDRFDEDIKIYENGVTRLLGARRTTQGQFDALVSFAYNVGLDIDSDNVAEGLGDSTLLKKHLRGDTVGAADEFLKWNKQKGKVLNGLTRRRVAERELYLS